MGVMVPAVDVRRGRGGGFHSDAKPMKRLDQWTVPWVPVCVCVCSTL